MIEARKAIENLRPYVPGRPIEDVKRQYGLTDVVKLASNENPFGASPLAVEALKESAAEINFYPDGACTELRAALAEKLGVTGKQIVFGTGTDEIISLISAAFIDEGDEMITGTITFPQYMASVAVMAGKTKFVEMKNFAFDLDAIASAITDKTRIIYVANPNNPTGTVFTDAEKIAFLNKVPRHIIVALDEAYEEFVETEEVTSSVPLLKEYDNLIVMKTFSKAYGLAGLRVGYAVMNESFAQSLEKIRKPFNVPIPAQMAAIAALKDDDFIKYTHDGNIKNLHYAYEQSEKLGLEYIKSEANFFMLDTKLDSAEVFEKLMSRGYIIRPGKAFGADTYLRVSIGTMEQMEGFFKALKEVLEEMK